MYLYENHMGGLYSTQEEQEFEDLYCEQCGDSDWFIGEYETLGEYWNLIKDDCSINGSGGWSLKYIYSEMCREFNLPKLPQDNDGWCEVSDNKIIKIIEKNIKEKNNE